MSSLLPYHKFSTAQEHDDLLPVSAAQADEGSQPLLEAPIDESLHPLHAPTAHTDLHPLHKAKAHEGIFPIHAAQAHEGLLHSLHSAPSVDEGPLDGDLGYAEERRRDELSILIPIKQFKKKM